MINVNLLITLGSKLSSQVLSFYLSEIASCCFSFSSFLNVLKLFSDQCPFCGATDSPFLDLMWLCPWVLNPVRFSGLYFCLLEVMEKLSITSGDTPAFSTDRGVHCTSLGTAPSCQQRRACRSVLKLKQKWISISRDILEYVLNYQPSEKHFSMIPYPKITVVSQISTSL